MVTWRDCLRLRPRRVHVPFPADAHDGRGRVDEWTSTVRDGFLRRARGAQKTGRPGFSLGQDRTLHGRLRPPWRSLALAQVHHDPGPYAVPDRATGTSRTPGRHRAGNRLSVAVEAPSHP